MNSNTPGPKVAARIWLHVGLGVALALVLVGSGWVLWQKFQPPFTVQTMTTSGTPQVGGPFVLVDQEGNERRDSEFLGRYLLVYFGYTYCPDICPTTLLTMSRALEILGNAEPAAAAQVVPLFITVDPERDTVAALASYAPSFHPGLVALTGTPEQIASAAKAYRIYYAKVEEESAGTYLMDHSSFIFLMGPDGSYRTHFNHLAQPEDIAEALQRHIGG